MLKLATQADQSAKDDGAIVVDEDRSSQVTKDGACQHHLFKVLPFPNHVGQGVSVTHMDDVLLNDRSLVQIAGYVMAGGPDDFYPTKCRSPIRVGTRERRKK